MLRACPRTIASGRCVLVVVCALGCAPAPVAPGVRPAPSSAPRWETFDAARAWPAMGPPRPSRGHGTGDSLIEVRVSPDASAAYGALVPGATLPVGAVVAAFHRTRAGSAGSVFAMAKAETGVWEFAVTEPDGVLVARGALPACAACHDAAPADHLFGPPLVRAPRN